MLKVTLNVKDEEHLELLESAIEGKLHSLRTARQANPDDEACASKEWKEGEDFLEDLLSQLRDSPERQTFWQKDDED